MAAAAGAGGHPASTHSTPSPPSPATPLSAVAEQLLKPRVVFVLGATGSGKTRLAVDLALALDGEIVNSDSVQMYRGLDIASAKVSEAEKRGVPHHLLSFLGPRDAFGVREYKEVATRVIEDIVRRGKLPIVVGGTMYYVQALIRDGGVLNERDEVAAMGMTMRDAAEGEMLLLRGEQKRQAEAPTPAPSSGDALFPAGIPSASSETPYERLRRVDPVMANRLHPNDERRIQRALEVFDNTGGVPYSAVVQAQARRIEGSVGPYNCKIFWLQVGDLATHNRRLDARVATMLRSGLLREQKVLRRFLESEAMNGSESDALTGDVPTDLTLRALDEFRRELGAAAGANAEGVSSSSSSSHSSSSSSVAPSNSPAAILRSSSPESRDYTGLLAAIGYKEFDEYWAVCGGAAAGEEEQAGDSIASTIEVQVRPTLSFDAENSARKQQLRHKSRMGGLGIKVAEEEEDREGKHAASAAAPILRVMGAPPLPAQKPLAAALKANPKAAAALQRAVTRLCDVTHQYAKKQERWIQNRFAARGVLMTRLDTSLLPAAMGAGSSSSSSAAAGSAAQADGGSSWASKVFEPALADVRAWLGAGRSDLQVSSSSSSASPPPPSSSSSSAVTLVPAAPEAARIASWKQTVCRICGDKVLNGAEETRIHMQSKSHRRKARRARDAAEGKLGGRPRSSSSGSSSSSREDATTATSTSSGEEQEEEGAAKKRSKVEGERRK